VIYGDNATGKSRLGVEWLKALKAQEWRIGKIDASFQQLDQLAEFEPLSPTAIVFDNAELFGDRIWLLIEALIHKWNNKDVSVRILLISHSDLEPQLGYYDRSQKILTSRFEKALQVLPIVEPDDCRELVKEVGTLNGVTPSGEPIAGLIEQTGGSPAFLSLAAVFSGEWRAELKNYAKNLLRKGELLFGSQGIDLVLLSALVGPLSDQIRHHIAPETGNLIKLTELFSKPAGLVSEYIPRIQPDILANEIIFEGFATYFTKVGRDELIARIIAEAPDMALTRVIDLWRESLNAVALFDLPLALQLFYSGNQGTYTPRAGLLESLFFHVAKQFGNSSLTDKFNDLYKTRASAFARALLKSEEHTGHLLEIALDKSAPGYGLRSFLAEISRHVPCRFDNRKSWALLLDFAVGADKLKSDPEVADNELISDLFEREPAWLYEHFYKYLHSEDPIERVVCQFRLANWANTLAAEFETALDRSDEIVERLYQLLEPLYVPDFIASARTLEHIVLGPLKQPNPGRIGNRAFERTHAHLHAFDYNSLPFVGLVGLWSAYFFTFYKFTVLFSWFEAPAAQQDILTVNVPEHISSMHRELLAIMREPLLTEDSRSVIALALLRTGWWSSELEEPLRYRLMDKSYVLQSKFEILIRIYAMESQQGLPFFQKLLLLHFPGPDLHFKYVILAGIYGSGMLAKQGIAALQLPPTLGRIDVFRLYDDAIAQFKTGVLGNEATALSNLLKDVYIGLVGNSIHKLKARDNTGRWAYYFIFVEPENELAFMNAIKGDGTVDLEDYGKLVASSYGEQPTQIVKDYLKEKYGFDI